MREIPIRVYPGETIIREARFRSTDGTPIDLTGASLSINVPGLTPPLTVQVVDATRGRVVIRQDGTSPVSSSPGTYRGRLTISMPTAYGVPDIRVVPVIVVVGGDR
jgi:hypothetical protein